MNGTKPPSPVPGKAVVFMNNSIINFPIASGSIRKVDDQVVSTFWSLNPPKQVEVVPGPHLIAISCYSSGYACDAKVFGTLKEGRVYEVRATLKEPPLYSVALIDSARGENLIENSWIGYRGP